jgi:hypothetical protein
VRSIRYRRLGALAVLAALMVPSVVPATAQSPSAAAAGDDSAQVVLDWNQNTLAAFVTSGGPGAISGLSLAMVHGAIYDAVMSIAGGYEPYLGKVDADPGASKVAAAATAAHDVLAAIYPDQAADIQALLDTSLGAVADGPAKDAGIAVGKAAAAQMLAAREGDGRGGKHPLTYGDGPGEYRPTPPDMTEFGAAWLADVKPFLADSADYYRTEGPYALDSAEYAADFNEVKTLGALEGSARTPEQDALVAFWQSPFGQWSGAERSIATEQGLDIVEAARLFAISGLAAGDGAIGTWNDKYHWMFWRPVTAIHEAADDGNDATEADPDWAPLINSLKPPNTPPYPDQPSGWNMYSGAIAGAMQEYFGTDEMAYKIGSPNVDTPRSYTSFTEGLQDGIELRILEGIHFRKAEVDGVALGQKAAALAAERLAPAK